MSSISTFETIAFYFWTGNAPIIRLICLERSYIDITFEMKTAQNCTDFQIETIMSLCVLFSILFSLRCLCQNEFCTTILFINVALFHFHTFQKRLSFFLSKWIVMGMSSLRLSRRCYMQCRCCGARDKIYLSSTKHGSMFNTPLTNLWLLLIISCKKFPLMILQ